MTQNPSKSDSALCCGRHPHVANLSALVSGSCCRLHARVRTIKRRSRKYSENIRSLFPLHPLMHLREEALEQYAMGRLPSSAMRDFELHLLRCHPYQDRTAEMDAFVAAIRM